MTHRDRIEAYFRACSEGSAADIASHFTRDAVVFDTNHAPVRGAESIGEFWVGVRDRWSGAAWSVDTCIDDGDAAAIEWTMTGVAARRPFAVRGSEHYRFEGGRIAEIRQYWTFDRDELDTALVDFPYASRSDYAGLPSPEGDGPRARRNRP